MRRVALLGAALLVVAVSALVLYNTTFGPWGRIRRAAGRVGELDGLELVSRRETGSAMCFISCPQGEPMLELEYKTRVPAARVCQLLREAVDRAGEDTVRGAPVFGYPSNSYACSYKAVVSGLASDGEIAAATEKDSAGANRPAFVGSSSLNRGEKLVYIVISSGIE